jgi:hypothetical protein
MGSNSYIATWAAARLWVTHRYSGCLLHLMHKTDKRDSLVYSESVMITTSAWLGQAPRQLELSRACLLPMVTK